MGSAIIEVNIRWRFQIEKSIAVLKAFYHEDSELVHQEMALYKVKAEAKGNSEAEKVISENNARILNTSKGFIVIEKIGHLHEITQ